MDVLVEFEDDNEYMPHCVHIKIYNEKKLKKRKKPTLEWECIKCKEKGKEESVAPFVYKHEHLLELKRDKPYRYNED